MWSDLTQDLLHPDRQDPSSSIAILSEAFKALDGAWRPDCNDPGVDAGVIVVQNVLGSGPFINRVISLALSATKEGEEDLASLALWVLVRLCRRRLDKATVRLDAVQNVAGRCKELLSALSAAAIRSYQVAHSLCYLIMIIASDNEEMQLSLCHECGAAQLVVQVAQTHSHHNTTMQFALRAMRNLGANDECSGPLVQAGACEALVATLGEYAAKASDDFHQGASRHSSSGSNNNSSSSSSMEESTSNAQVVECALWAAVNLVCDDSSAVIFGAAGGVDAVCQALEVAITAPTQDDEAQAVIIAALRAVRNLQTNSSRSLMHFSRALPLTLRLLDKGYLGAVLEHDKESEMPQTTLWCLSNLCGDALMRKELLEHGALRLVFDTTITVHNLDLSSLPLPPREDQDKDQDQGDSDSEVRARDVRHSVTGPVAEAALWTIRSLAAAGKKFRHALVDSGAVELCQRLLREYQHREGMARLCCESLLCLIAGDEDEEEGEGEEREKEKGNGAPVRPTPPNLDTLRALDSDPSGPSPLLRLLCDTLALHQAQADAAPMILGAGGGSREDDDLQQPVLMLMVALTKFSNALQLADPSSFSSAPVSGEEPPQHQEEQSKPTLRREIVRVVCHAMETHPTDHAVARLGCEVLAATEYLLYAPPAPQDQAQAQALQTWLPVPGGPGKDVLAARGLLQGEGEGAALLLGGKTMGSVLHAWMPATFPPPPPPEDKEDDEDN